MASTSSSSICIICKSFKEVHINIFTCEESPWLDRRLSKLLDVNLTIYKGQSLVICEDCLITFEKIEVLEIIKGDFISKFRRKMRSTEPDNSIVGFPVPACDVQQLGIDWTQPLMRHGLRQPNTAVSAPPPVRPIVRKPSVSWSRHALPGLNTANLCVPEKNATALQTPVVKRKRGRPRKHPLPPPPPPPSPPPLSPSLVEGPDYFEDDDPSKPYNLRRRRRNNEHKSNTLLSGQIKSEVTVNPGSRLRAILENETNINDNNSPSSPEKLLVGSDEPPVIKDEQDLSHQALKCCIVQLGSRIKHDTIHQSSNALDEVQENFSSTDNQTVHQNENKTDDTKTPAINSELSNNVSSPVSVETANCSAEKKVDSSTIHVDLHVISDATQPSNGEEGSKYHCTSVGGLRLKIKKDQLLLESDENRPTADGIKENHTNKENEILQATEMVENDLHRETSDDTTAKESSISGHQILDSVNHSDAKGSEVAASKLCSATSDVSSKEISLVAKSLEKTSALGSVSSDVSKGQSFVDECIGDATKSNILHSETTTADNTTDSSSSHISSVKLPEKVSVVNNKVTSNLDISKSTDASRTTETVAVVEDAVNSNLVDAILSEDSTPGAISDQSSLRVCVDEQNGRRSKRKQSFPVHDNRKCFRSDMEPTVLDNKGPPVLISPLNELNFLSLEKFYTEPDIVSDVASKMNIHTPKSTDNVSKASTNHVKMVEKPEALFTEVNQLNKILLPHEIKVEFSSDEELCEADVLNGATEIVNSAVQEDEGAEQLQILKINQKGPTMIYYSQKPKEILASRKMNDLVHEPIGIVLFNEGLCRNHFDGMLLCGSCTQPVIFTEFASYEMHLSICHQRSLLYKCSTCGAENKSAFSAESHLIQKHSVRTNSSTTSETSTADDGGKKEQSAAKPSDGSALKTNPKRNMGPEKKNTENQFHCGICNIVFNSHKECFDHMDIHANADQAELLETGALHHTK